MQTIKNFIHQHRYSYLGLYVPVYLLIFFTIERVVPTTGYWVSYIPWDDAIPFCEYFVVFYCMWYVLLVAVGVYLLLRDEYNFRLYMYGIMIGFTASLLFCLLFPNGQDLRPAVFSHENIFTWALGIIYRADTNTNVIPSMHVIGAMMASFAVFRSPQMKKLWMRIGVVIITLLINLSTVFIKQHSLLDVFAGLGVSVVLYILIYGVLAKRIKPPAQAEESAQDADKSEIAT